MLKGSEADKQSEPKEDQRGKICTGGREKFLGKYKSLNSVL